MSALGHKRTFAVQNAMSAVPPKADMCSATRHVRFVPIATSFSQLVDAVRWGAVVEDRHKHIARF